MKIKGAAKGQYGCATAANTFRSQEVALVLPRFSSSLEPEHLLRERLIKMY